MLSNYFSNTVYQFIKFIAASIAFGMLLTACASQPTAPQQQAIKPSTQKLLAYNKLAALSEPQRSIAAIDNAVLAAQKQQYTLSESYLLLAKLNHNNANRHLNALEVAAELIRFSSQTDKINLWFDTNEVALLTTVNINIASTRVRANAAMRQNNYLKAVKLGLKLSNTNTQSTADAAQLWQAQQALSLKEAKELSAQQVLGSAADGWAQLATAYLDNGNTVQQQATQLGAWQQRWPTHPAIDLSTNDIVLITQRSEQMLDTAVVAIPLSGLLSRAGKAIQAAMLAAHLERPQFKHLIFVNSASFDSTETLLTAINEQSPQVIIGPLDKTKAHNLAFSVTRTTPMISLNSFISTAAPSNTYQMSLNIEDEAAYLAQTAPAEHSRALLVSTNNPLAIRATDAFKQAWLTRDEAGVISTELTSSTHFSKHVEAGLLLTDSKARQIKLENIFIEKMESNPRRRRDIDLILLAGTAAEARAINPLLAYHYAGNLPVFAPSIIFDGQRRSVANKDLSGIIFSDTPWSIEAHPLKPQLEHHILNGGTPSKNLHALGIDAYYLAARSGLWKTNITQSFNGVSGHLQIARSGKIKRRPRLALMTKRGIKPYQVPHAK